MAEITAQSIEQVESIATTQQPPKPFRIGDLLTYAVLLFGAFLALLPFIWMLSWSVMTANEVSRGQLIPNQILLQNYTDAWNRANFGLFMWNSVRISVISIVGMLLFCVPAAYAFAKMKFFGKNILFAVMLATLMIPDVVTLIPNFLTVVWFDRLGQSIFGDVGRWINNWPSLTVPFMASAFTIFLLRQFFAQLPDDLWEAARIDGAGHFRYLISVVIPLSKAPIMTVITLAFIASWNSLLWPLLVANSDDWRPIAFGLSKFVTADASDEFHLQMAASVIMVLPIIVLYFFTQKQFTEGIASSGLKG
ncbi:MAG: carbohydrate ABC transporter permease [Anaerolineae bacterium]|jgi:ABC-type glycerol-3-phosphate transport system permease component|nr:carbohydrate ABC transporter permease [Anaerolineae bacterium]